jgi:ABC-type phosphate transport system substrate-binding protein
MNRLIRRTALRASAAALLSAAASAAMAQTGTAPNYNCPTKQAANTTCINGGGSTLAANVYTETTPAQGIFTMVASVSGGTLGIYYEPAGSGAGQTGLASNDPFNFGNGDTAGEFVVHYAASDAYITSSSALAPAIYPGTLASISKTTYPFSGSGGAFIQLPMFATPIAISINNPKVTADGSGSKAVKGSVAFTDSDLCGIFSGKITNWGATSAKAKLTAGTIHVYWRADNGGSGTTFLLLQHLAAVCNSSNTMAGFTFKATTKFATLFAGVDGASTNNPPTGPILWVINPGNNGYASNFIGAKGNPGVAGGVLTDSTSSAIGYNSPDYTSIAKTPAAGPYSALLVADVKNSVNNISYAPDVGSLLLAMQHPGNATNPNPPTTKAQAQVQTNWVPAIASPAEGYPIMGYTNLDVAQCYKNAVVAKGVMNMIKTDLSPVSKTLLNNNGFQPTIGGNTSGWGAAILSAFVTNTGVLAGANLNIGNTTACAGVTGR